VILALSWRRPASKLAWILNLSLRTKKFLEFGGGGRMATFKLWKDSELVKIQVNYVENILFKPKNVFVKTLLDVADLKREERAYFKEFWIFTSHFK
jgi:hypothetical protein